MYKHDAHGMGQLMLGKDTEHFVMQAIVLSVIKKLAIIAGKQYRDSANCHNPDWTERTERRFIKVWTVSKQTMEIFNTVGMFIGLTGSIVVFGGLCIVKCVNYFLAHRCYTNR